MIYCITGKLIHTEAELAVVGCGGVGYACRTSNETLMKISSREEVTLYTYLSVREDSVELFGFASKEELEWFRLLLTVSGVGAKAALTILSGLSSQKLSVAIASGDTKAFTSLKGVGAKTAQRIVMELQSKVAKGSQIYAAAQDYTEVRSEGSPSSEAAAALVALGYSQSEAATEVAKLGSGLTVEEYIKGALKSLSLR